MKDGIDSGVYLLKIKVEQKKVVAIGAIGQKEFLAGYYFYAGTAQRNLSARIKRHYSSDKKNHWHIDYLLAAAELEKDFIFQLPKAGECFLAQTLREAGGQIAVDNFGASDCSCESHLLYFSPQTGKNIVENLIKNKNLEKEFTEFKN